MLTGSVKCNLQNSSYFRCPVWKLMKLIKSKLTQKLKHANSILEYFEYFCQMSSESILIISSYTVTKLTRFLRHIVVAAAEFDHQVAVLELNYFVERCLALTRLILQLKPPSPEIPGCPFCHWAITLMPLELLKSTHVARHCQVKSSQVECDQVDGGRLGVILASSRVVFLYRSDSQVL